MSTDDIQRENAELALAELQPQLYLLAAPRRALREMIGAAAARLALKGPVRVVDGGNSYDAHAVARLVMRRRPSSESRPLPQPPALDGPGDPRDEDIDPLQRIYVARAFTCYQVEALLESMPAEAGPVLILDLLQTFTDENAPLAHRDFLVEKILKHLGRLAERSPVLVGVTLDANPPLDTYVAWLAAAAEKVWRFESSEEDRQMPLFE